VSFGYRKWILMENKWIFFSHLRLENTWFFWLRWNTPSWWRSMGFASPYGAPNRDKPYYPDRKFSVITVESYAPPPPRGQGLRKGGASNFRKRISTESIFKLLYIHREDRMRFYIFRVRDYSHHTQHWQRTARGHDHLKNEVADIWVLIPSSFVIIL